MTIKGLSKESLTNRLINVYIEEVLKNGNELEKTKTMQKNTEQVANWLLNGKRKGLVINGTIGNGKTTMMQAIRDTMYVLKVAKFDEVGWIDSHKLNNLYLEDKEGFKWFSERRFLFIDDLGENNTEILDYGNNVSPITELLRIRYAQRETTICSSNKTKAELSEMFGERIADRIKEMFDFISFNGISYRK